MKTLSNSIIAKILDQHNIGHYTENGRIYGLAFYTTRNDGSGYDADDLTGSTETELRAWLGY